jgi:hypothetical protein
VFGPREEFVALSYFVEDIGGDQQLWVTDGTSPGTHVVAASFGGAEIPISPPSAVGSSSLLTLASVGKSF